MKFNVRDGRLTLQPSILADTLFGRYNTILIFSCVCLAGHIILTATSIPSSLANPSAALAGLVISILIMGLGAGSIKANVSPLIAEQYTGKLRKEILPSGEVVIKSPSVTIQSIYLWFYAAINVGAACSISAAFLARDKGYWVAYLLPTSVFLLVPLVLIVGKKHYVTTPPRGSILLELGRVIKMAARGKWTLNLVQLYKNFHSNDFWTPAKPCK
jgi:POT family proton-dependent oligopeptide transporter